MTATKQTTAFDGALATARDFSTEGLKVAANSARTGFVKLRTSSLATKARSSAQKGWSRFQDTRNQPIGKVLPMNLFKGTADPSNTEKKTEENNSAESSNIVTLQVDNAAQEKPESQLVQPNPDDAPQADYKDGLSEPDAEFHKPDGIASYLPTAVIVAGLATLCILTVLTTGPVDETPAENKLAVAKAPSPLPVAEIGPATITETGAEAATETVSAEADSTQTRIVVKPVQLAATVAPPVIFKDASPDKTAPKVVEKGNVSETGFPVPSNGKADETVNFSSDEVSPARQGADVIASQPSQISAGSDAEPQPVNQVAAIPEKAAPDAKTTVELQLLQGENERLKEMMAALESETLHLNSELLQLELSLAEANDKVEPRQVVETRTVYNFVNVPLGGGVTADSSPQYEASSGGNYVNNSYVNNQYPSNDQYNSGGQEGYLNPALVADMPPPEMGWSPDGQLMPPNHELYRDDGNYANGAPDPYFDQRAYNMQEPGYGVQSDELLYGDGADIQYGPAGQPVDLRSFPPVNN